MKFLQREHQTELAKVNESVSLAALSKPIQSETSPAAEPEPEIPATVLATTEQNNNTQLLHEQLRQEYAEKFEHQSMEHRQQLLEYREELADKQRKYEKEWESKRRLTVEELTAAHDAQVKKMKNVFQMEMEDMKHEVEKAKVS